MKMWYTIVSDSWHPGGRKWRPFRPKIESFEVALYAQTFPSWWKFPQERTVKWKWLSEAFPPIYAHFLFSYKLGLEDFTLLDLFAGIGGWSLGAVISGARKVVMIEIDKRKCQYLETNFTILKRYLEGHHDFEFKIIRGDVREVLKDGPKEEFDVIVASPPCEDASVLRALSHTYGLELRGTFPLTRWYLEWCEKYESPLALYENVISTKLEEMLRRYGWTVEKHDMGKVIPQRRRRIIAIRKTRQKITSFL